MGALLVNKGIFCFLHGKCHSPLFRGHFQLFLAFFVLGSSVHAQTPGSDSLRLGKRAVPEIKQLVPAVLGLSMTAFLMDEPANRFVREHQSDFLDQLSAVTDAAGEKAIVVPALVLTYSAARFVFKNERLESTSLQAMQSVVVTALATEGLKHLAGRSRPFNNEGAYTFEPFPGMQDQYKSLPSGHASLAFALFTPFAEAYSRWIYMVPVSVAAGRVYQNKHWVSDVMLGGGIGFISGYLFAHHPNVTIIPGGLRVFF